MILSLRGVRHVVGAFQVAVDADFTGRVTGLFGPSGAGKTSLLEIVAGLRRPDAGVITLGEQCVADGNLGTHVPPHRRRVGYVPQEGALFPHMSVLDNIQYGAASRPDAGALRYEDVVQVLEIAGLARRSIHQLSGGEKQRVACARALLASPRLLLLDEPLASLDESLKERILPYFRRIRDDLGVPMVYVTHDPSEILALCDQVHVMERGRFVASGPPDSLFESTGLTQFRLREPLANAPAG